MRNAHFNPSLFKAFRFPVAAFMPLWLLAGAAPPASAQNAQNAVASETREWAQGAADHAQQMRVHKDPDHGSQPTPPIISNLEIDDDPGRRLGTFHSGGAPLTPKHSFLPILATNP